MCCFFSGLASSAHPFRKIVRVQCLFCVVYKLGLKYVYLMFRSSVSTCVYESNRELPIDLPKSSLWHMAVDVGAIAVYQPAMLLPHAKSRANEYLKYKISNAESFMIRAAVNLIRYKLHHDIHRNV